MAYNNVKPFMKWAGGKTQLLDEIRQRYSSISFTKYCEPFIGGGAVYFDILSNIEPELMLINDINIVLTNTYIQVRDNLDMLLEALETMQMGYWCFSNDEAGRKREYMSKRDEFNTLKKTLTDNSSDADKLHCAALFLFLNRTCFNGLYRENKNGDFNSSIGSYRKPLICDESSLRLTSILFQNTEITTGDYENCLGFVDSNTFVYLDPPYRPVSGTAVFNNYTQFGFNDIQQTELAMWCDKLNERGAKFLLSNSAPDDDFFDKLYKKYNIQRISAKRNISGSAEGRDAVDELLISNF